jgi:hypothetical protein
MKTARKPRLVPIHTHTAIADTAASLIGAFSSYCGDDEHETVIMERTTAQVFSELYDNLKGGVTHSAATGAIDYHRIAQIRDSIAAGIEDES